MNRPVYTRSVERTARQCRNLCYIIALEVLVLGICHMHGRSTESANVAEVTPTPRAVQVHSTPTPNTRYYDVPLSYEEQDILFEACDTYNVDVALALAVMEVESNFTSNIISQTNDYGLFQINSTNHLWLANELGDDDFLNPETNIKAGCRMLQYCLDLANNKEEIALMFYNMGPNAQDLIDAGTTSTTYTQKVLTAKENYT